MTTTDIQRNQVKSAEWLHRNFHKGEMEKCHHFPCRAACVIKLQMSTKKGVEKKP